VGISRSAPPSSKIEEAQMSRLAETLRDELHRDREDLQRLRGDLELQLHLMNMEAKARWQELEKKWQAFRNDAKLQAGTTARQFAEELKRDYRKLKDELRGAL
jgi:hypothetical protein